MADRNGNGQVRAVLGAVLRGQRRDGRVRFVPGAHPRPAGGAVPVARLRVVVHQPAHLHRLQSHLQARLHPTVALQVSTTGTAANPFPVPITMVFRPEYP